MRETEQLRLELEEVREELAAAVARVEQGDFARKELARQLRHTRGQVD